MGEVLYLISKLLISIAKGVGAKAGSIGKGYDSSIQDWNIVNKVKELSYDEGVSQEYLKNLIKDSKTPEHLGRILHYVQSNRSYNLSSHQATNLSREIFERFKEMKLQKILEHFDITDFL